MDFEFRTRYRTIKKWGIVIAAFVIFNTENLNAQNQITTDNSTIEVYPKIITIRVNEQVLEKRDEFTGTIAANVDKCFQIKIYDSVGLEVPHNQGPDYPGDRIEFFFRVSDSMGCTLQSPIYDPRDTYRYVNWKKPIGWKPGLYSIEVSARRVGLPPPPGKILKETVWVNVLQERDNFFAPMASPPNPMQKWETKIKVEPFERINPYGSLIPSKDIKLLSNFEEINIRQES
jgi:hypothetical protein